MKLPLLRPLTEEGIRKLNLGLGVAHALQGLLILLLSNNARGSRPVILNYMANDSLAAGAAKQPVLSLGSAHLYDISLAYVIAAFLFITALIRLLAATRLAQQYQAGLADRISKLRWVDLAVAGGLLTVAVALTAGAFDITVLLLIFGMIVIMGLLGLVSEASNYRDRGRVINRLPLILAGLAAGLAWFVVLIYTWAARTYGGMLPAYVVVLVASLLAILTGFLTVQYLQTKRQGDWGEYRFGEQIYLLLMAVAQTAVAWQIFFGTLR